MAYDKALIAGKLRRWEKYLIGFRLPAWEDIPDFGLYMEQVVDLLKRYLDYMPPELKEEDVVTSSAINNYVRRGIMPGPRKKKYYRLHIAYQIMICALKQSLNMIMTIFRLCCPRGRRKKRFAGLMIPLCSGMPCLPGSLWTRCGWSAPPFWIMRIPQRWP